MLASTALLSVVKESQSVHQAYVSHWLQRGVDYNIAILTAEGADSFIYAPFDARPFSLNLPPIDKHRSRHPQCVVPFSEDEVVEPSYLQGPRWVLTTDGFSNRAGSLKNWRNRVRELEIKSPSTDLTRAYVGCSFCGYGGLLRLLSGYELQAEFGITYVRFRWLPATKSQTTANGL